MKQLAKIIVSTLKGPDKLPLQSLPKTKKRFNWKLNSQS